MHRAGYCVTLIGLGERFRITNNDGIRVISLPQRRMGKKFALLTELTKWALREHADVYHCLDPWCLAIGYYIKMIYPAVNLVYESSEWFPQTYLDRREIFYPIRWLLWLLITGLEYKATKSAAIILETNKLRAQRFVRRNRTPVQVPNYPPLKMMGEPLKIRNPWFIYTGLICRARGFDRILMALASVVRNGFPEVKLLVRGEFSPYERIEAWVQNFIIENKLVNNVLFLKSLPFYSQIFEIIKPCLAGVILLQPERGNDWTNQPNKLFEFMGCGVAVIASDFPEISSVVKRHNCGWLVDPTSPEAIAEAMTNTITSPQEAIARGLAGREAVAKFYNWETAEKALLGAYRKIVLKIKR